MRWPMAWSLQRYHTSLVNPGPHLAKMRTCAVHCHAHGGMELRVCTGRTCKRQGSQQVLKNLKDLSAGHERSTVSVIECGCLGGCGAGPNMILLPQERVISHVATPADAAEVLSEHCGLTLTPELIQSTQLRSAGNQAAMQGDLQEAVALYSQALDLHPPQGMHLLYSNRAAALMQLKRFEEALTDAQCAVQAAPRTFTMAWVRLIDCLYALGRFTEAAQQLRRAESECYGFTQCNEYKSLVHALKGKVAKL